MEGIQSIRKFLHVDWVILNVCDDWITSFLEDINDVGGFDLGLLSSLFLFGPSH